MIVSFLLTLHLLVSYTPFMTPPQIATYKAALKEARNAFHVAAERMAELSRESNRLAGEIARLRRTITALAALCSEEPGFDDLGITDVVSELMEREELELTSADVVKELESMGFDLSSQKNANASVHAILSRMATQGKIKKVIGEDRTVSWRGPKYDPDAIPF
jgi:hypothetical protein